MNSFEFDSCCTAALAVAALSAAAGVLLLVEQLRQSDMPPIRADACWRDIQVGVPVWWYSVTAQRKWFFDVDVTAAFHPARQICSSAAVASQKSLTFQAFSSIRFNGSNRGVGCDLFPHF